MRSKNILLILMCFANTEMSTGKLNEPAWADSSEVGKVTSKVVRVSSEVSRVSSEADRISSEVDKVSSENTASVANDEMTKTRKKRKAADSSLLWPNATVPFIYGSPEPDKPSIMTGISHWEKHTCIRFTKVSNASLAHIIFRNLEGCRSSVGRKESAGQNISIGDTCTDFGIVVHEIGHALGFYHEIRRPDRDDHVVINSRNIETAELFNFHKAYWLGGSVPYDLSSVMHYTSMEWSKNGKTTVATKDPTLQGVLDIWKSSDSAGLSHRDKYLANTIYGCLQSWLSECKLKESPCQGEGYLGQHCHCICPPGTSGTYCEKEVGSYYDNLRSQCTQEITYDTIITSPNYPNNYDPDTWCVYIVNGSQCRSPVLTILDFQMGPRDKKEQCYYDFLEIRNESLYDGFKKCGTEVTPGYTVHSSKSTMVLYFKGSEGGYRGFRAKISFEDLTDCCRAIKNKTSFHVLSPQYPGEPEGQFNCTIDLQPVKPAKIKVMSLMNHKDDDNYFLPNENSTLNLPCGLILCQSSGCKRGCLQSNNESSVVFLPNSGSIHHFHSRKSSKGSPTHLVFQTIPSPCHKVIELTKNTPNGHLTFESMNSENLQCEWWIKAPSDYHVKLFIKSLSLNKSVNNYFAINEAGLTSFPESTSRAFASSEAVPDFITSLDRTLIIVLQGDQQTRGYFTYELYNCIDSHEDCAFWSSIGECKENPYWMLENCKFSCNLCEFSVECKDNHHDCSFWSENNQCKENEEWMSINCRLSCGHCDSCENRNPFCEQWKALDHCQSNLKYMETFCPEACQLCNTAALPKLLKNSKIERYTNDQSQASNHSSEFNSTVAQSQASNHSLEFNSTVAQSQASNHSSTVQLIALNGSDVDRAKELQKKTKYHTEMENYKNRKREKINKLHDKKHVKKIKDKTMGLISNQFEISDLFKNYKQTHIESPKLKKKNVFNKFEEFERARIKKNDLNLKNKQKYKYSKTYRNINRIDNHPRYNEANKIVKPNQAMNSNQNFFNKLSNEKSKIILKDINRTKIINLDGNKQVDRDRNKIKVNKVQVKANQRLKQSLLKETSQNKNESNIDLNPASSVIEKTILQKTNINKNVFEENENNQIKKIPFSYNNKLSKGYKTVPRLQSQYKNKITIPRLKISKVSDNKITKTTTKAKSSLKDKIKIKGKTKEKTKKPKFRTKTRTKTGT